MSVLPGTIGLETNAALNEALWRFGGMHGRVLDLKGNVMHEIVQLTADANVARIAVALAGTNKTGHKPGRVTREGTLNYQKLDTAWEMNLYRWLKLSLQEQKEKRGHDEALMRPFSVVVEHDDPGALGYEQWQLDGCLIWQLGIGMNIGEDLIQKSVPVTWERETPLHAFERTGAMDSSGLPAIKYVGALDGNA